MEKKISDDKSVKEMLLKMVKKEVKQIMEESVYRRFVHEDSGSVISLCAAVEACIQHGLRTRMLGLFRKSSSFALLLKIRSSCTQAAEVCRILNNIEKDFENNRKSTDGGYSSMDRKCNVKYLWIKIALTEKHLAKIIEYLVLHSSKYYENDALIANPVSGTILASLLDGPCALEYTRMKTIDHLWTDPPANELIQRHRMHSGGGYQYPSGESPKKHSLQINRNLMSCDENTRIVNTSAKEYVKSMHQNSSSVLLYGKNNLMVQPKEGVDPMAGYLSLHKYNNDLIVKWIPNELMKSRSDFDEKLIDKSFYWEYAMIITMEEIVYLHCHQNLELGSVVLFIGQDGVQRPPIHFPHGGHLIQFLSCIEAGLQPFKTLDPPLWSYESSNPNKDLITNILTEKLESFSAIFKSKETQSNNKHGVKRNNSFIMLNEDSSSDYVFKITSNVVLERQEEINGFHNVLDHKISNEYSLEQSNNLDNKKIPENSKSFERKNAVKELCHSMSSQIMSRAFFGWLQYCRHLKIVRLNLSRLVHQHYIKTDSSISEKLKSDAWNNLISNNIASEDLVSFYNQIYYAGCDHQLRKEVWPFLLGLYKFNSSDEDRRTVDEKELCSYNLAIQNWSAIEELIKKRESQHGKNKSSHSDDSFSKTLNLKDSTISLEVFDSSDLQLVNGDVTDINIELENNDGVKNLVEAEVLENIAVNFQRIDKDVHRCDRNHAFFKQQLNLDRLRNIMCTYVWENIEIGYMQGMCDLAGPLLVILNDESKAYSCFSKLMERLSQNFPCGVAMDQHFHNMTLLIEILDPELYEHMKKFGDYKNYYFAYRWFLLDFKREFVYEDTYTIWETIWSSMHVSSSDFVLFIALAFIEVYRDIIIDNQMDYTDIIKFFNEMAEKHNVKEILTTARNLVTRLQDLLSNQ